MDPDLDAYLRLLLQIVRTAVFIGLAVYCLRRAEDGPWARLAVAGGATITVVSAFYLAAQVQVVVYGSAELHQFLVAHHVVMLLDLGMTVGLLILVTAVVTDRASARSKGLPTTTSTLHG